jgi:hypothetical protein
MNRIERRVRNFINPYSTAFAAWWCHSGRFLMFRSRRNMSDQAALLRRSSRRPGHPGRLGHVASPSMAERRAAVDEVLASRTGQARSEAS